MKIDDRIMNYEISKHLSQSNPNETTRVDEKQLNDEQKVQEKDLSGQDTIVQFSRESKEAQLADKIISSEPDVRQDKVAELKEKIQSGQYQVDNEAVANKLVDALMEEIF